MTLHRYTFRRKDQLIATEVLCDRCLLLSPEKTTPLSDREEANGYRTTLTLYSGEEPCADCGSSLSKHPGGYAPTGESCGPSSHERR